MAEGEVFTSKGVKIKMNYQSFTDDLYDAFDDYTHQLEAQFGKEISAPQFKWPKTSYRGSGKQREETGSPRDIVDSGFFRESITVNRPGKGRAIFTWNAPYSKAILTGYKKKRKWPARNWIAKALKNKPPFETLRGLIAAASSYRQ
ncbi:MAG: hypothetical protein QGG29_08365 [Prochlorococcaceae cyanobacterium ETNP18_MAG_17]|jgi:hypothetical protein|nr:hypothetical protein [Prochlorococcaceae cyanobacterium ETNP18_MAG_17]